MYAKISSKNQHIASSLHYIYYIAKTTIKNLYNSVKSAENIKDFSITPTLQLVILNRFYRRNFRNQITW